MRQEKSKVEIYSGAMQFELHELQLPVRVRTERATTDEEPMRFSRVNEPLRIEQESNGDLVALSPTGTLRYANRRGGLRWGRRWCGRTLDSPG